ncbi:MAG: RNA polymerase sigma factor [Roseibacillus sp.]
MILSTMSESPQRALFQTTQWSMVVRAADDSKDSLEELCQQYWLPVYGVARRAGYGVEEAKDLTQGFFSKLLEKGWLESVDSAKGRFRTFLVTAFKRYMVGEWHRDHAAKRGGLNEAVPLDDGLAERLYLQDEALRSSPEALFDRRWALTLLDLAMKHLEEEYRVGDRQSEFRVLKPCLTAGRGEIDYGALALDLSFSEGTARVAVHRLRKRFRSVIREEIARTVETESEVDDEMRELFSALMQQPRPKP